MNFRLLIRAWFAVLSQVNDNQGQRKQEIQFKQGIRKLLHQIDNYADNDNSIEDTTDSGWTLLLLILWFHEIEHNYNKNNNLF